MSKNLIHKIHETFKNDIISLHVYNNSPNQITLPLGLLGYCETNATTSPTEEVAYRVNYIPQLLNICQLTIFDGELSEIYKISNEKRNTENFTKYLILNQPLEYHIIQWTTEISDHV